jgi:hypothetical protein
LDPGATLNVTNRSGITNFAIGDKWDIINWYGGLPTYTFTVMNLPPLPYGYTWTNYINDASFLSIEVIRQSIPCPAWGCGPCPVCFPWPLPPRTIRAIFTNGAVTIYGSNPAPGMGLHYVVLNSTDLKAPMWNWTPIATNSLNSDGSFSFTAGVIGNTTNASYFCIKVVP